jgi:type IV secretory pathway VirB10-like protein
MSDVPSSPSALRAPDPPAPRRLNTLALVVLTAAVALFLGTAVYFISKSPNHPTPATAAPPAPSDAAPPEPGFLKRPPRSFAPAPPPAPPLSTADQAALDSFYRQAQANEVSRGPGSRPGLDRPFASSSAEAGFPPPAYPPPPIAPPTPVDGRRDAFNRALHAPIAVSLTGGTQPSPAPSAFPASPATLLPGFPSFPGLPLPATTDPNPSPHDAPPVDPTAAFLAAPGRDSRLAVTVEPPGSPFALAQGTLLPAVLITAINSDLPGDLTAQIARDVYDSRTQRILLIPRGSRLVGRYQNQIAAGQNRLLVAWDRLLLPNGSSLRFPGLPGVAQAGDAGLPASVNNHLSQVFGSAVLLSLIGAGVQLSQPQESAVLGNAASSRQIAAAAVGQELSSVALEILRRRLTTPPTLTVRAGTLFNVFARGDITLPPYPTE